MPTRANTDNISYIDLRNLRKGWGFSQEQMALTLGVSFRMYCYYERGQKPIPKIVGNLIEVLEENRAEHQPRLSASDKMRLVKLVNTATKLLDINNQQASKWTLEKIQKFLLRVQEELTFIVNKN
ncbi:helix-turn-helix domain-containing protein [Alphaproteobacteria bacterium]|nr:helix-turn-helix domain-containing protein [Alphaproteobacteria bacterium]